MQAPVVGMTLQSDGRKGTSGFSIEGSVLSNPLGYFPLTRVQTDEGKSAEVITDIIRNSIQSYKQLPLNCVRSGLFLIFCRIHSKMVINNSMAAM